MEVGFLSAPACCACEDANCRRRHAQKILKVIQKEANSLKRASPAELTDAKWKSLDDAMSQYVSL
ncbi:hypothetical protein IMZ48_29395 [Candidatus Bathyarchaeota archaeon]|nr:hypothetical protein [Candidatus Bathyarchaeota archaeon]